MLDQTIKQIEDRIAHSDNISEENRAELVALLATLRAEVNSLAETRADDAARITASAAAATDPDDETDLNALSESVRDFEATHPRLAQTVNNICHLLSSIGI